MFVFVVYLGWYIMSCDNLIFFTSAECCCSCFFRSTKFIWKNHLRLEFLHTNFRSISSSSLPNNNPFNPTKQSLHYVQQYSLTNVCRSQKYKISVFIFFCKLTIVLRLNELTTLTLMAYKPVLFMYHKYFLYFLSNYQVNTFQVFIYCIKHYLMFIKQQKFN